MGLDPDEIVAMFQTLDLNGDGSISYEELVEAFADISTRQIVQRINKIVYAQNYDKEFFFNRYAVEDYNHNKLRKHEFIKMVKDIYSKVNKIELENVYKHFDRGQKNYISKDEFLEAFSTMVVQKQFNLNIEDIIKPLQTKTKKFNVNLN